MRDRRWGSVGLLLFVAAACGAAGAEPSPIPDPFPTTTTTTLAPCRNSYEPRCGEFRYDPPLQNREMRVDVTFSPPAPKAGQEVLFTVTVDDDGPAAPGCVNYQQFSQDDDYSYCTTSCVEEGAPRYGPWDPPPPENGHFTEEFRHAYPRPGTKTATFAINAGDDCSRSKYRSKATAKVDVPVG